jgi:HK97 family phage major capsid protein
MNRLIELLTTDAESELIPSALYNELITSVRENLVGTQVLARRVGPEGIPGSTLTVALNTRNAMLCEEIAEGAEFPKSRAKAESFDITPKKYGLDIQITREMIEDSRFNDVIWQVEEAGWQMARKLDTLIWAQVEAGDTAASHTITGAAAITVANISTGISYLRADGYNADYLIVSAAVEDDLHNIDTFHEADKVGNRETFERGLVGRIMGMTVIVSTQVTANYAYVVDSRHALMLVEKRPISIENYKQENNDLVGIAVSARWGVRYLRAEANCVITTT